MKAQATDDRANATEQRAKVAKDRAASTTVQAMEEYKDSNAFMNDTTKAGKDAYFDVRTWWPKLTQHWT